MNPMVQAALGAIIRWGLTFLAGYLVRYGVWSSGESEAYVAAASIAGATLIWSLWQKYKTRLKFLTALDMPAGTSEKKVDDRIKSGGGVAPVILLAVALGAGALGLTSCAKTPPNLSPGTISAVKAAEVVKAVDVVRDEARIIATAYPAVITPADWQHILTAHEAIVTVIGATPDGWKPAAEAGLDQLQKDLSPTAAARLQPYLLLVRTLVAAFVPGGPQ